jgi:ubiquinone/menaquinone biosynthesis C-methylase UbiE
MDSADHTRSRYDAAAPIYDLLEWPVEQWLYRGWREELWAKIEGPEILEIGVGTGRNIPYYPEGAPVTAIDLSPKMLERARRIAARDPDKGVTLLEMNVQDLDLPSETFDEVVATFVFCSVPDPVEGLHEALRVTCPGGRLHLLEHVKAAPRWLGRGMEILDPPMHWLTGVHIARETVENVRQAGWTVEAVTPLTRADLFVRIDARKPVRDSTDDTETDQRRSPQVDA